MCGIAGIWSYTSCDIESIVRRMIDRIAHRGPDSDGVQIDREAGIALGHRRLSIVELSEAGHQPMDSACGRFSVVYNGEIYNHLSLRTELESAKKAPIWRGSSDTETLLAAIRAWGLSGALERFNGMFAFALWDRERRVLSLARDRFGEKPLYYGLCEGRFVFGSELRVFREAPGADWDLDETSVSQFLRYSTVPAPRSIYKNIKKLSSGSYIEITQPHDNPEQVCYWDVNKIASDGFEKTDSYFSNSTFEEQCDLLHDKLRDAVGLRLMSDVPLGAFLSGGIDSSLVVALMQEHIGKNVSTFTIGFEEQSHDESEYAKAVADYLGTHHVQHIVSGTEALDVIPSLPDCWDEPFADSSQIPTLLVSRLARKNVTVCLSGDGGDELFGGYSRYQKTLAVKSKLDRIPSIPRKLLSLIGEKVSPVLADSISGYSNQSKHARRLVEAFDRFSLLAEYVACGTDDELYEAMSAIRGPLDGLVRHRSLLSGKKMIEIPEDIPFPQRMMQRDLLHYLPEVILTKVDRASMSVSLESRAPFLDHSLAQYALGMPWELKCKNGKGKWPLYSVLKRYLPENLIDRPKKGFGVPISAWLRGPLLPWAEDLLQPGELVKTDVLNVEVIVKMWQQHKTGRFDWHYPLWNVLMFQAWIRSVDR